jgi:hypothetical protein
MDIQVIHRKKGRTVGGDIIHRKHGRGGGGRRRLLHGCPILDGLAIGTIKVVEGGGSGVGSSF